MDPSKSSPAIAGDRVFVGIDRNLTALDRATGRVLWQAPTGRKVDSTPLVVGDVVYVGSDDRTFYAFDAATGRKVWSYATGGRVSSSPTSGEGLILIGSDDGALYAFEEEPAARAGGAARQRP
jgi:outer membrane protein assembly factor BamB